MANDTYTIVYYDSADSAHTTALADLVTAGGSDIGSGIVDATTAYFATGILFIDGSTPTHLATGVYNGTYAYAYGMLDDTNTYYTHGILNGDLNGATATWAGYSGILAPYVSGSSPTSYNAYGILDWDNVYYSYGILNGDLWGSPTDWAGYSGILTPYSLGSAATAYYPDGIFDGSSRAYDGIALRDLYSNLIITSWQGNGIYEADPLYASTTYNASGIFSDDDVFHGSGILYYDGFSYVHASFGIMDGEYYYATGVAASNTYYADGCWNDTTSTYYPIETLDVLGGGLA